MTKKPKQKTKRAASKSSTKTKDPLQNLKITNGKSYEEDINRVRKLEELLDVKQTNPFGTSDIRVFEDNLASMNLTDMQAVAVRAGVFPNGNQTILKQKLIKAFKSEGYGSVNAVIETDKNIDLNPKNPKHKAILDYLNS